MSTCKNWLILGIMVIKDKEACLGKQRVVEKTKRRFPWRKLVGFNCRTEGIKQNIGKQRWKNLALPYRYLQIRDNMVGFFFFLIATNILAVSPTWGEDYSFNPWISVWLCDLFWRLGHQQMRYKVLGSTRTLVFPAVVSGNSYATM